MSINMTFLCAGDRVLEVNGVGVSRLTDQETIQLLSSLPDRCVFLLQRHEGYVETASVSIQVTTETEEERRRKAARIEFESESSPYSSLYPGFCKCDHGQFDIVFSFTYWCLILSKTILAVTQK